MPNGLPKAVSDGSASDGLLQLRQNRKFDFDGLRVAICELPKVQRAVSLDVRPAQCCNIRDALAGEAEHVDRELRLRAKRSER